MAKEKRTSKIQEEMEQMTSSCASESSSSCSSVSDNIAKMSSECQK
ncbi:hypothetical protein JCM14036_17660 [Desulfotomaculum defluvii]